MAVVTSAAQEAVMVAVAEAVAEAAVAAAEEVEAAAEVAAWRSVAGARPARLACAGRTCGRCATGRPVAAA